MDQFVNLGKLQDPFPVTLTLSVTLHGHSSTQAASPYRPCKKSLKDPVASNHFVHLLKQYQPITWDVGVEQQYAMLVNYMQEAAEEAFPRAQPQPRKTFISDNTFQLVLAR